MKLKIPGYILDLKIGEHVASLFLQDRDDKTGHNRECVYCEICGRDIYISGGGDPNGEPAKFTFLSKEEQADEKEVNKMLCKYPLQDITPTVYVVSTISKFAPDKIYVPVCQECMLDNNINIIEGR